MAKPLQCSCLLVFGCLAGCTTFNQVGQREMAVHKRLEDASLKIQQMQQAAARPERETIRYVDNQWVSPKAITVKENMLAAELRCRLKLAVNEPVTILEFGQIVTRECGISLRITPDALSAIDSPYGAADLQAAITPNNSPAPTTLPAPPPGARIGNSPVAQPGPTGGANLIDITYKGELKGLLDMVTARFGLSYKVEPGRITIYNVDSETFYLHSMASVTDMSSVVQSGTTMVNGVASGASSGNGSSTGTGGSSGTNQTTAVTLKSSVWDDVKASIESMKSRKGSYAIAPSIGAITVTDNADVLSRVRSYVKQQNAQLEKQVLFNIKLVAVSSSATDALGLSWDAVYQSVGAKFGFKLTNAGSVSDEGTKGALAILTGSGSPWAGTTAILSALAEQGAVSILREPSASTLNMKPVSLQVARQDGFLAGAQTSTTAAVGTTTALQTGVVTTGFNMSLLPYVLDDNRMLLQFSVNLSNNRGFRKVSSNGASAEVPQIDLPINSSQQVKLKAGDTLILTGFDQEDEGVNRSGTGTPSNLLLGGGLSGTKSRSTLVVLITPIVME